MNNVAEHAREQKAGMKCPQCGAFIETSIFELLTSNALQCPSCHLRLNIDRMKSKAAFDALRKVQNARHEIDFFQADGGEDPPSVPKGNSENNSRCRNCPSAGSG